MPSQKQIREDITARIVTAIESGVMPWRRPWKVSPNAGRPTNVVSKAAYRGVNPILLSISAMQHGFASKWWATYRQWHQLGCQVKKRPEDVEPGEWGTTVVFAKPVSKATEDPDTGEETEQSFFLLRYYTVFCADQVEGAERFQVMEEPGNGIVGPDYGPAEELIAATGADIRHGGERAYYSPVGDFIQLPHRERFGNLGAYYETALHEVCHWTEHSSRLNWDREAEGYAMGELRAEIAACFLASEIGIPHGEGMENHASYVKSWLDQMKGDSGYIFRASRMASATTDFLLSFVREPEPVAVG